MHVIHTNIFRHGINVDIYIIYTTLLPCFNIIAEGMFCGVKSTHHALTRIIKPATGSVTTCKSNHWGEMSLVNKSMRNSTNINGCSLSHKKIAYQAYPVIITVNSLLSGCPCTLASLSDLFTVYTPSRQLQSSANTQIMCFPHIKTEMFGQRFFKNCSKAI